MEIIDISIAVYGLIRKSRIGTISPEKILESFCCSISPVAVYCGQDNVIQENIIVGGVDVLKPIETLR